MQAAQAPVLSRGPSTLNPCPSRLPHPLSWFSPPDLQHGLAPVIDRHIRVLVLGSFPGAASLAAQQYYAHPRNQFWPLLGALTGEPLPDLPYADRLMRLLSHGIGVWDVLGACVRRAAWTAISAIRKPTTRAAQGAGACVATASASTVVRSGRFAAQFEAAGYETVVLPSIESGTCGAQF